MDHFKRLVVLAALPLAATPAIAQDRAGSNFSLSMPSSYSVRLATPRGNARDPLAPALPRVVPEFEERPFGFLPKFGAGGAKSDKRGLSFGVRPGKSPKAVARFRF